MAYKDPTRESLFVFSVFLYCSLARTVHLITVHHDNIQCFKPLILILLLCFLRLQNLTRRAVASVQSIAGAARRFLIHAKNLTAINIDTTGIIVLVERVNNSGVDKQVFHLGDDDIYLPVGITRKKLAKAIQVTI